MPHRPIHLTVDNKGSYAFVTYADPCGITVHRLADDGSIGETVPQPNELDVGSYGHQARTMPGNRAVVLVARGHNARGEAAEVPGALKVFSIDDGVLHNRQSVAPGGGFGFGPRHLDFHPTGSWMYVSLERQNALQVFAISENDAISGSARYSAGYLEHPAEVQPRQMGGTVHVHPSGRFVYVVNRADRTKIVDGKSVFAGGENSIVVFSIDERTGEPRLIQRIAPETMHVRTFAIDPSGALLVAAGIMPLWVPRGEELKPVPAALSVFRIGQDGKLSFVRKHEVDAGPRPQWWMGIVTFAETA